MQRDDSLVKMFRRTFQEMTKGQRRSAQKRRDNDRRAQRDLKHGTRYGMIPCDVQ
jgi:hypothetical protein